MKFASILALCATLSLPLPAFAACHPPSGKNFVLKDDLAIDRKKGLIWKRCAVGMRWRKGRCSGAAQLLTQEEAGKAAQQAGPGWHVPSGEELETLLIDSCKGPKIDGKAFPGVEALDHGEGANYWTTSEAMPGMFYYFDFTHGFADMHSPGFGLGVLLVRKQ